MMTNDEAIVALDHLDGNDDGHNHSVADNILLAVVDPAVAQAYRRLVERANGWYYD